MIKKIKNNHNSLFFSSNSQGSSKNFFILPFRERRKLEKFIQNAQCVFILLLLLICNASVSQTLSEKYAPKGELFIQKFESAPFPHPDRKNGHIYKGKTYTFQNHYNDNNVIIFIPKGIKSNEKINIVFYIHGWFNSNQKAIGEFNLIQQFSESNKNAIFVVPEVPKNAPDSFGGKFEDKNGLLNITNDVLTFLLDNNKINSDEVGKIILSGHSGAYRAIAFSLSQGGLTKNISDVILFDGLYGQTEKFTHWIENYDGRMINIYTDDGGTKQETESLIKTFNDLEIPYLKIKETNLKNKDLRDNRLILIHSDLTHNEVVSKRNQFCKFLKSCNLEEIKN